MDWDQFAFDWTLRGAYPIRELIAIEAQKLSAQDLVLPPEWRAQLQELNRVRAVRGTMALEGNPISEAEIPHLLESAESTSGAVSAPAATREQTAIRNAGLAQDWGRSRFGSNSNPLSVSDILHMHRLITGRLDMENSPPGHFRRVDVSVGAPELGGVHRGAPHEDLPRLMEGFIAFLNSPKMQAQHPVICALLAHFFLATVHPFADGNGRVSRLVEEGILVQSGYGVPGFFGLSNFYWRNESGYKTALQKCRERQPFGVTPFIRLGLEGVARELEGINNFVKNKLYRIVYRDMLSRLCNERVGQRRRTIHQREYNLLDYLIAQTEPIDPFSRTPSRRIKFSELYNSPFIRQVYRDVTRRTFWRELERLSGMKFIKFNKTGEPDGPTVELDLDAVGMY